MISGFSAFTAVCHKYFMPSIISCSPKTTLSPPMRKYLLRPSFASRHLTTHISASGATPEKFLSSILLPQATPARNVPCPFVSTLGTMFLGLSDISASLILLLKYSAPNKNPSGILPLFIFSMGIV